MADSGSRLEKGGLSRLFLCRSNPAKLSTKNSKEMVYA